MANDDLANINIENGVNDDAEAFCTVTAANADGTIILIGQLSPDEIRSHAMGYLGAAEAAEQDAAVLRVIRRLSLPDELAGAIIVELRNMRGT